jgi:hypothetical protein
MSGSVHQSVHVRFVPPNVHTFQFVPPHSSFLVEDDSSIPFSSESFSAYDTFEQIRNQIATWAPGAKCRQVNFRYTVHPAGCSLSLTSLGFANPFSHTASLEKKELSSEDFIKVLECCDQKTQDPEQAIANTKTCWQRLFPN